MNVFRRIQASLRLTEAIRQADAASARTGLRYFVVPDGAGHLVYMDRANFRGLKRKHYITGAVRMSDLRSDCFYHTSSRGGGAMTSSERRMGRRRYYAYLMEAERERKRKKEGRASRRILLWI